ncbi:MAG: glycosyltransferase [Candidatus Saelkia tenebricola]|nr:glycosyltransferase [Candidatus Saelkia tenebricola]
MDSYSKVVVIIPAYNAGKFIKKCLKSVLAQDYPYVEIRVVDNNSQDDTADILNEFNIPVIRNIKNYGVCFARNQVIKNTNSEYVMTLDSDVILQPDYISKIIHRSLNASFDTGMWGGTVLNMRDPKRIDSLGIILTKFYRFYDHGAGKLYKNFKASSLKVIGPCACAAVYKRSMLENIVGANGEYFDSKLHYLVEDFDVAIRAQNKGYRFEYIPEAIGYHYRGGSNINSKHAQYLSFRNRYFLILKYFKLKNTAYIILSLLLYDLPRLIFLLISNYSYTKTALKELQSFIKERNRC